MQRTTRYATDSHGNTCYLVVSTDAMAYVESEVTDRGVPIGEGLVVGPDGLKDAKRKVEKRAEWDAGPRLRIFALVEVVP